MKNSWLSYGKFLSLVLRHKPATIGLILNPQGWADIDSLLSGCRKKGLELDRETLERIVEADDKQRFQFSLDGLNVRACQGHTIPVDLDLEPIVPPDRLYHGTTERFLPSILKRGLVKGRRHHVHLSLDIEAGLKVGSRRGPASVLEIRSGEMHRSGLRFYLSANGVWLTDHVPPQYLRSITTTIKSR
jgi:putative RNA 2'-phosphotransferase